MSIGVKEVWDHFYLSNKILVDLIPELTLLRVLSLRGFDIKEVPEVISSLKHLWYLNLSQTQIVVLSENVGNLYNLQSLIVSGCRELSKLPNSFLNLKKLRHFIFDGTALLKKMPLGIGGLKNLQTLSNIIIEGDDGLAITELKDLNKIHGLISIERLDKVQNARHASEANLSEKRLTGINLQWVDEFDCFRDETLEFDVLNTLTPSSDSLINLRITFYGGIEFPKWVGDTFFERLVRVSISGCRKCTSLPPLGKLPTLKTLGIANMNELKVIGPELLGANGVAFPKLETLSFLDMKGWEVWSANSGAANAMFPCLRELYIQYCPNLIKVSMQALPLLKDLAVLGCRHTVLRSVVQVASSITKLRIDKLSGLTYKEWRGVMEYLGAVENIEIRLCNEIRYMWESEAQASKVLANLRKLDVFFCDSLVSLGEKEESDYGSGLLTSLTMLRFWHCKSMERCMCPNSIEMLIKYLFLSVNYICLLPNIKRRRMANAQVTYNF